MGSFIPLNMIGLPIGKSKEIHLLFGFDYFGKQTAYLSKYFPQRRVK